MCDPTFEHVGTQGIKLQDKATRKSKTACLLQLTNGEGHVEDVWVAELQGRPTSPVDQQPGQHRSAQQKQHQSAVGEVAQNLRRTRGVAATAQASVLDARDRTLYAARLSRPAKTAAECDR